MISPFLEHLEKTKLDKRSYMCVGLDPALPGQRTQNTIDESYLKNCDENEARLNFCLDIIDATREFACAYKPNQQYLLGLTKKHHQKLTSAIREAGAVSILDYKLNDITDSTESAMFHIRKFGYDAVTFNPLLGNLQVAVKLAQDTSPLLGLLVLTLTSNPEAVRYLKKTKLCELPLYLAISEEIRRCKVEGAVVGATSHITETEMREIRNTIGEGRLILIPGIGIQEGDLKLIQAASHNILVNISRTIIYSQDKRSEAKYYNTRIRNIISKQTE